MAELSPAARAIVDAFDSCYESSTTFDIDWVEHCLAEALTELANRIHGADHVRDDILDIAKELRL